MKTNNAKLGNAAAFRNTSHLTPDSLKRWNDESWGPDPDDDGSGPDHDDYGSESSP